MWIHLATLCLTLGPAGDPALLPRQPLPKGPTAAGAPVVAGALPPELVVKFRDDLRVRATAAGGLRSLAGGDLAAVEAVARRAGLGFAPLIASDEAAVEAAVEGLLQRARERSGVEQPDLFGMLTVAAPGRPPAALAALADELRALAEVEFAEVEQRVPPPPGDYPPTTPSYTVQQAHLPPNPGFDFREARLRGADGAGIRLADCEYGWDLAHEDLVDQPIVPEPGQTPSPLVFQNGWHEHGTAALGISAAAWNPYGCDGGAAAASFATFPEFTVEGGPRRATCILNALTSSRAGDVVLLEMQTGGPTGGYGPAELDASVWTIVRAGTDADVVVVAAAGNGGEDLDSAPYTAYRARGDSGAIIVGAGSPDSVHAPLFFSTFGARVDVQGWGASVFTLGYGQFVVVGGDPRQSYTNDFSGTSSASACVAAAATALQSDALARHGAPLGPHELRDLLIATGRPQPVGTREVGPFPDLAAALDVLAQPACGASVRYCPANPNSSGTRGRLDIAGTLDVQANDLVLRALACSPQTFGVFLFGPSQAAVPSGLGVLCVGQPARIGVAPTSANGSAALVFDNTPTPNVPHVITPGSTWNFQFWYRDAGSFNFSDALALTYCP